MPKSHFKGKTIGYYATKHTNHLGGKSFNYEISSVKVIFNDDDMVSKGNINSFDLYYGLLLILIMI